MSNREEIDRITTAAVILSNYWILLFYDVALIVVCRVLRIETRAIELAQLWSLSSEHQVKQQLCLLPVTRMNNKSHTNTRYQQSKCHNNEQPRDIID